MSLVNVKQSPTGGMDKLKTHTPDRQLRSPSLTRSQLDLRCSEMLVCSSIQQDDDHNTPLKVAYRPVG